MAANVTEVGLSGVQNNIISPIDQTILRLQREGKTTHQIAEELKMTERMVQLRIAQLRGSQRKYLHSVS
jgi:DNA-binding NarL/FixJ family response regulator